MTFHDDRPKRVSLRTKELILQWNFSVVILSLVLALFWTNFLLVGMAGLGTAMLIVIWIDPL